MFTHDVHAAVALYQANGYRCMPIHGADVGCKHLSIKCDGQCFGKVPKEAHWPDKNFTAHDFSEGDNIALIMGKQTDGRWLVGLDIDGELDLSQFFQLPETLECVTRRGRHLIFEVAPNLPLGNWIDALETRSKTIGYKPGYKGSLDIKYCRGAMVSPPSKSKTGEEYRWVRFMPPAQLPWEASSYIIRKRRLSYPLIKRYPLWTMDPLHKGKKP